MLAVTVVSALSLAAASANGGPSVLTRSYDNARTGATTSETILTPDKVAQGMKKLLSIQIPDDPRIEAQPLYVPGIVMPDGHKHDVLYVFSMANTVWAFDANTGAALWPQPAFLGNPFRPPPGDGVDVNPPINVAWGIVSTPVIDLVSSSIYIVTWIIDQDGKRALRLHALRLRDGKPRRPALPISASMTNAAGQQITLNQLQKQRAALLLQPLRGNPAPPARKMLYVAFTGSENPPLDGDPTKANHGWVVAFDVKAWKQTAAWVVTPSSFGGGIWHSSQGPAADEQGNVYVMTGNGGYITTPQGVRDFNGQTDFAESFVKLTYRPGPPASLTVADWFSPFRDSDRRQFGQNDVAPYPMGYGYKDQDLAAGGPILPPGTSLLLGAGKDGVLYVLDRNNLGKAIGDFSKLKAPPSFFTWIPDTSIPSYAGATPTGNLDFKPAAGVKMRHLHGTPVYWKSAEHGGMLFVWGENGPLRAWSLSNSGATTHLARSAEISSAAMADPAAMNMGGMPGGQLALSANGDRDGIVWATVPIDGDANRHVVAGIVRAYDATQFDATPHPDGTPRLRLLWSATGFNYSKFCPPLVADGKVFVPTYDGRIDVYTLK
jgi:outer membrane protein assembly factor BamB